MTAHSHPPKKHITNKLHSCHGSSWKHAAFPVAAGPWIPKLRSETKKDKMRRRQERLYPQLAGEEKTDAMRCGFLSIHHFHHCGLLATTASVSIKHPFNCSSTLWVSGGGKTPKTQNLKAWKEKSCSVQTEQNRVKCFLTPHWQVDRLKNWCNLWP